MNQGNSKLSLRDQIGFFTKIQKIIFKNSEDFVKYCCVGFVGAMVNLGTYLILNRYFKVHLEVASLIAIETSIISNFILNNYWTFKKREKKLSMFRRLVNFHIAASITGVIFYYLFFLFLVTIFMLNDILSVLLAIAAGTVANFVINSSWTWSK